MESTPEAAGKNKPAQVQEQHEEHKEEEDEWPPFKKVGQFDPYSDDPRLAVKKVFFCGSTGKLVIGGTAGMYRLDISQ